MPEKVLASKSRLWYNEDRSGMDFADVAEWQTHQTQNLTRATSCGFKSRHPHSLAGAQVESTEFFLDSVLFLYVEICSFMHNLNIKKHNH